MLLVFNNHRSNHDIPNVLATRGWSMPRSRVPQPQQVDGRQVATSSHSSVEMRARSNF